MNCNNTINLVQLFYPGGFFSQLSVSNVLAVFSVLSVALCACACMHEVYDDVDEIVSVLKPSTFTPWLSASRCIFPDSCTPILGCHVVV